jgi:regulatory protein
MEELVRAKRRALYLLTDMDRTEKELYDRLKKTGYSEETVNAAMEYVKSFGYIDDVRYARKYIEIFRDRKSRLKMTYDMAAKGVDREVIENAFLEYPEYDETDLIRRLAVNHLHGLPHSRIALRKLHHQLIRVRSTLEHLDYLHRVHRHHSLSAPFVRRCAGA